MNRTPYNLQMCSNSPIPSDTEEALTVNNMNAVDKVSGEILSDLIHFLKIIGRLSPFCG